MFPTVVFGVESGVSPPSGVGVALLFLILLILFSLILFLLMAMTRRRAKGRTKRTHLKSSPMVDPWREAGRRIQPEEENSGEFDRE